MRKVIHRLGCRVCGKVFTSGRPRRLRHPSSAHEVRSCFPSEAGQKGAGSFVWLLYGISDVSVSHWVGFLILTSLSS